MKKTLMEELNRYKAINKYASNLLVVEQVGAPAPEEDPTKDPSGLPPTPDAGGTPPVPDAGGTPPPPGSDAPPTDATLPEPGVDDTTLPEPSADDTTEDVDVTDLVNMTKDIKNQLDDTKNSNAGVTEKMDGVFTKLTDLENKLSEMGDIIAKIDQLGAKVDQMKTPTPVEKLEMRSLDSYPFSEHPDEFFEKKQGEMRASGKNEYVLTKDDVKNYARENMLTSFNPEDEDDNNQEFNSVKY